jgi:hypothetical protein
MNEKIPEELISAYIDGELTSDEQVRVEQALLEDPQSQQLLEDLQALHDRLQAIPRSEPSQDYTQQILRRAERAILTGPSTASGEEATTAVRPANPGVQANQPTNLKHLIWASTALAATLMLALLFRSEDQAVYQVSDAGNEQETTTPPTSAVPELESNSAETDDLEGEEEYEESAEMAGGAFAPLANADADAEGFPGNGPAQPAKARKMGVNASFGAQADPAAGGPSANQKGATTQETVIYINISQEDFEQQAVLRTLVEQQVAFNYDPMASANLATLDTLSVEGVATADLKKDDAKNVQQSQDKKAEEKSVAKDEAVSVTRRRKRDGSYRVITLEATAEKLDQLLQDLSDHHQVQRTPRGKADLLRKENPKAAAESGSAPGLTTNLSEKRGRKPVQQPGGKSKDKADKNQTAKRADEKQNEARKPTATKLLSQQEGQALKASRVRIVLVVQASSGSTQTVSDQADTPASPAKKPKSQK